MSKQYKNKVLLDKHLNKPIKWKHLKDFKFEDEDEIRAGYIEPFYSESNSWDGYYSLEITRQVLETDKEYEKRIEENKKDQERYKKQRYENYLKLKKEFENE